MKRLIAIGAMAVLGAARSESAPYQAAMASGDYPYSPAKPTDVSITGGFWLPRFETNRLVTLKTDFEKCAQTRIPNFVNAANRAWGSFNGIPYDDSDVYKVIEGAANILAVHPDAELEKYVDGVIAAIAGAQEPDGYLYTARTLGFSYKGKDGKPEFRMMGPTRWSHLAHSHELYNVGHLYEAAVAWYETTGKRNLLDVAIKSADLIDRTFGPGETQLHDTSGHEEIELALAKLYRATGEERYLELAKYLLDRRGKDGPEAGLASQNSKVFTQSGDLADGKALGAPGAYAQQHLPVVAQREAVGHAVRATYLYCGMADIAALSGNDDYIEAIDAIWENVAGKKLALNGSVGARRRGEAFGANYELPNETAYNETCAGIGNALWNERMFLLHGDAKYIDVMELALYNGIVSGVSLSGDEFFYPNPLASKGGYKRSKWFRTSCCPVNIVRFIPQIAEFAYATRGNDAFVNLFVESNAKIRLDCGEIGLSQNTQYPWSGNVKIDVTPPQDGAKFALRIRIPGWCVGRPVPSDLYAQTLPGTLADFSIKVNGKEEKVASVKGYCVIDRAWTDGDTVEIVMNMPVRRIKAHDKVAEDKGRLAVMRGPILYCAEGADNGGRAFDAFIPADATFAEETVAIGDRKYPSLKSSNGVTLIPYCLWDNREPGKEMQTWFRLEQPLVAATASHCNASDSVMAAIDGILPKSSGDTSIPRLTFWPHKGSLEWVQFDFAKPKTLHGVEVYWFDDTGKGECRIPESWKVSWRESDDGVICASETLAPPVKKDCFSRIAFPSDISARSLRMDVKLQERYSGGILEVRFLD